MTVTISDSGDRRIVEITGEQHGFGGIAQHHRIETHYSRETLEALLAAKGEMWLRDEIARAEEPPYVQEPLRHQLARFLARGGDAADPNRPVAGKRVLDYGCGCGASSICLARLGAASVEGVEPNPAFVAAARLRWRDSVVARPAEMGACRGAFHQVADTTHLPCDDDAFDVVVMNAVLEHIPPPQRRAHLREVWRVLAPGGHLFIGETPNRVWPKDAHTTRLWWIPYLPLGLARRYAIARGRVPVGATPEQLVSDGIRGATYWEVVAALGPEAQCLNLTYRDDVSAYWTRSLARPGQPARRLMLKRAAYALHRLLDLALCRPLGIPAVALMPALNLCLQKRAVNGR